MVSTYSLQDLLDSVLLLALVLLSQLVELLSQSRQPFRREVDLGILHRNLRKLVIILPKCLWTKRLPGPPSSCSHWTKTYASSSPRVSPQFPTPYPPPVSNSQHCFWPWGSSDWSPRASGRKQDWPCTPPLPPSPCQSTSPPSPSTSRTTECSPEKAVTGPPPQTRTPTHSRATPYSSSSCWPEYTPSHSRSAPHHASSPQTPYRI